MPLTLQRPAETERYQRSIEDETGNGGNLSNQNRGKSITRKAQPELKPIYGQCHWPLALGANPDVSESYPKDSEYQRACAFV